MSANNTTIAWPAKKARGCWMTMGATPLHGSQKTRGRVARPYKLKGWKWPGMSKNRYSVVGHYTNNLVFDRLAPGLLKGLRVRSPKDEKGNRDPMHLWLSEDVGDPMLAQHLYTPMMFQRLAIANGHDGIVFCIPSIKCCREGETRYRFRLKKARGSQRTRPPTKRPGARRPEHDAQTHHGKHHQKGHR